MEESGRERREQNVVVMRHGDRVDQLESLWTRHAERPWDPPLTEEGRIRAWATGKQLRKVGFPIHRAFVSPFLRCRETAAEAIAALCAVATDEAQIAWKETSEGIAIDPSRVKVSIEYGLCEMLNTRAISPDLVPKDKKWFPDISELEALLPAGTVDHSAERVYQQMPPWEESVLEARRRYSSVIKALADKYPGENLLLVTHGEGVGVAVTSFLKGAEVFEVEYCAYSHLQRGILSKPLQNSAADNFNVLTTIGIRYT